MRQTRLVQAGSWLTATQRRVSQRPRVLMSDLLTAQFLAAMPLNTSWCVSSCSTCALKQTWQYFISLPLGSTSTSGVRGETASDSVAAHAQQKNRGGKGKLFYVCKVIKNILDFLSNIKVKKKKVYCFEHQTLSTGDFRMSSDSFVTIFI